MHSRRTGSETVLLVEDDNPLRELTRNILQGLGYRVLAASGSAEAEDRCSGFQGEIRLLLTDVIMPGGDGRELAQRFLQQRHDIKILFISGYTEDDLVRTRGAARWGNVPPEAIFA